MREREVGGGSTVEDVQKGERVVKARCAAAGLCNGGLGPSYHIHFISSFILHVRYIKHIGLAAGSLPRATSAKPWLLAL